ncbi:MAG: hypothetical protein RL483_1329 [Pseudomonadota bacterium]
MQEQNNAEGAQSLGQPDAVWLLRKNCSLSPYQLLAIFGSLAVVSLAVAAYWASQGAWVVVPFAVVECLALGCAFLVYARHVNDHERIDLVTDQVVVECRQGSRQSRLALPRHRVRVELDPDHGLVVLRAGSQQTAVGRYVDHEARAQFLKEFRGALTPAI